MNSYHRAHVVAERTLDVLAFVRPSLPARFRDDLDARAATVQAFLADIQSDENLGRRTLTRRLTAWDVVNETLADLETLAARVTLGDDAARWLEWLRLEVPSVLRPQLEDGDD